MKFSNGVHADPEHLKRQGVVSVAWQSVVLDEVSSPSLADRDVSARPAEPISSLLLSSELDNRRDNWPMQKGSEMVLAVKDDLIGVPVTTNEFGQNAHAMTLYGRPSGVSQGSASLGFATDSMDEVVNIYLQQAEAYCDENQWEKAFEACQEALKVSPATAEAYKFLGKILQQQGRPTDAMGFYAKAITIRPNYPEVYVNLGSLYAKKGKWEDAVSYYKKAIEREPEMAIAYLNLAKIWKKLDRKDSELNCRATALRLQPDLGSAKEHFDLAQALEAVDNREGAVLFYQQAVEQAPKMVAAYERLADLLEDAGDWQAAATCYRKVLTLNAEAEKESAAQRSVEGSVGDALPIKLSPESQRQVQQLLQASSTKKLITTEAAELPTSSTAQLSLSPAEAAELSPTELARRYAAAKDWPRAIECIQAAIAQNPQSAVLHRSLAKLFEQANNPKLAAEAWYRSFVLEPSWPDAQQCFTLGRLLARYGNVTAAMQCHRHSLQLQPEFLPAKEALEALSRSSAGEGLTSQSNSTGAGRFMQPAASATKK